MLKKLPKNVISRLVTIYKCSIALGYIPKCWREARVVLIPKQGKSDYTEPKSFRPISLTAFMFKVLEKIIKERVETVFLKARPLSPHQHAFRSGKSCDSAIAEVIDTVESAIFRGETAIGVFLDISGAFDNILPGAVSTGMEIKGIDSKLMGWYYYYIRSTWKVEVG